MILDTNAVSDLADEVRALYALLEVPDLHHLPVIVVGEYRYGLKRSRERDVREVWLAQLQRQTNQLDVDRHTAVHYADVRSELREKGCPIPENDIWIAALARQHHLPIVSRDAHFDHVSNVRRVTW